MKIELIVVGRTTDTFLADAIRKYVDRIGHYAPMAVRVAADCRSTRSLSQSQQCAQEGRAILQMVQPSDYVVLLDEHGREYTSRQFAEFIQSRMLQGGQGKLIFIVGGPYGFSEEVRHRSNGMISLSRLTFPHEMVRLFFVEQLYRAMTIIRGEPYHHD